MEIGKLKEIICIKRMLSFFCYLFVWLDYRWRNSTLVIGDSHVNFFSGNEELTYTDIGHGIHLCKNNNPSYNFTVLHLGPSLAYNSDQVYSSTKTLEKTKWILKTIARTQGRAGGVIVLAFGEIDIRVQIFNRCRDVDNYKAEVDLVLEHYFRYIRFIQQKGYKVCCWGPVASQPDSCKDNPKFPRAGTEYERNLATLYFNEKLREWCDANAVAFMSIFGRLVDAELRTRTEFYSSDCVHLSRRALSLAKEEWDKHGFNKRIKKNSG